MKFQAIKVTPILALLLFLVACGADKNTSNDDISCSQVITSAYNPKTGETKDFPTPCDVPDGWKVGAPPKDTTPPVITLKGNKIVSLTVGEAYVDAGATAQDNVDGDLTASIIIDNPVDTTKTGTYQVKYRVTDKSNNKAKVVVRMVTITDPVREYGLEGLHKVEKYIEKDQGEAVVYYPKNINKNNKTPLIFFAPGFNSSNSESYHSLLNFIASHGYSVIYAKDNSGSPKNMITRFEKMLEPANDVLPYVDTTRIGVIGHSSGGGDTFKILDYFSKKGYGDKGRFIMALDPYMAFDMSANDMQQLPSNTNVVIIQFGDNGQGYDKNGKPTNKTDSIIPLTEYSLLTSIPANKKDYQVVPNKTHGYANGSRAYSDIQGVLKPLDALMDYTFNGTQSAHTTALEAGSDTPYKDGLQKREANPAIYSYGCKNEYVDTKIDYCVLDLNSGEI
jgi:hypothetical protein